MSRLCRIMGLCVMLIIFMTWPARAQPVAPKLISVAINRSEVVVDALFTCVEISLFGAIQTDGAVAVAIRGPRMHMAMQAQRRVLGFWLQGETVHFEDVPGFLAIASSDNPMRLAPPDVLQKLGLALHDQPFLLDENLSEPAQRVFGSALIRALKKKALLPSDTRQVTLLPNGLFYYRFTLPDKAPMGDYDIEAFLFRDGRLVSKDVTRLRVRRAGVNARLYAWSRQSPLTYALFSLVLAVGAAMLANPVRARRKRRS